jgi:hypothetical protein
LVFILLLESRGDQITDGWDANHDRHRGSNDTDNAAEELPAPDIAARGLGALTFFHLDRLRDGPRIMTFKLSPMTRNVKRHKAAANFPNSANSANS